MPPLPKDPALLQRRNKTSTRALLPSPEVAATQEVRALPDLGGKRKWHPMALQWWGKVCTSPMASEYQESDWEELNMLVRLVQDFWGAKKASERRAIAAEIRQQERRFGLTPMDRRSLQWEIERGETASERTAKRRKAQEVAKGPVEDPRDVLRLEA